MEESELAKESNILIFAGCRSFIYDGAQYWEDIVKPCSCGFLPYLSLEDLRVLVHYIH